MGLSKIPALIFEGLRVFDARCKHAKEVGNKVITEIKTSKLRTKKSIFTYLPIKYHIVLADCPPDWNDSRLHYPYASPLLLECFGLFHCNTSSPHSHIWCETLEMWQDTIYRELNLQKPSWDRRGEDGWNVLIHGLMQRVVKWLSVVGKQVNTETVRLPVGAVLSNDAH